MPHTVHLLGEQTHPAGFGRAAAEYCMDCGAEQRRRQVRGIPESSERRSSFEPCMVCVRMVCVRMVRGMCGVWHCQDCHPRTGEHCTGQYPT